MVRSKPENDAYYHVYNRGVEKRDVFMDAADRQRFILSMLAFNSIDPVTSLYHANREHIDLFTQQTVSKQLVEIVAYCLNQNHYHLILRQITDNGIPEFMKRLGGGYTNYFNERYERSGALFQGKYKHQHIADNTYLLYVSAYVNLNNKVHALSSKTPVKTSWEEYTRNKTPRICSPNIVLDQFPNNAAYESFAYDALETIRENKMALQDIEFS